MAYHTTTTSPVYVKLRRIKLSDLSFTDYTITDYDCVTGGIYLSYNNTSYWNAGASATGGANIIAMSHDCKSIMMFALAAPGGSNIWVYPDIANSFTKRGIAQLGSSNYFAPNSDSGFAILCTSTSNNVSTSYWASPVTGTGIIYDVATDTVTGSMKGDAYIQVILGMYDKTPLAQCKTTSAGTVTGVYDVRNGSLLMSTATNYAGSTLETFITDKTIMLLVVTSTGTWYFKFGFSVLKQGG
jgi:hypothetical protein